MADQPKMIMVVDDDHEFQQLMKAVFSDLGEFAVCSCLYGRAAPSLAKQKRPDLVILDLAMPDMDGWEVLASLRVQPETASIPVLIVSAAVNRLRRKPKDADRLGKVITLEKPFDLTTLTDSVDYLLQQG
jgi:CheY-like chemotaxis protein